ncbi:MAG: GNAT family N-acetyltransferase [Thermoplasmata archaeon]
MRILTFDELSASRDADRALVHLSSLGGTMSRRDIGIWRRRTKRFAEYVGLFAVERGTVLGQLYVLRIPYTFPDGPEVISGIASVGTRGDHGGAGIARSLLTEAHRRDREAGIRYASLWTNRSWGAHRLYESLGYQDVYSFPWAVRLPAPHRARARRPMVRPARTSDLEDIDRLHARLAEGRLGFNTRLPGFSTTAARAGWIDPAQNLLVAHQQRRLVGYAHLDRTPRRVICGELVATSGAVRRTLLAEVDRAAKGAPVAFQHTLVTDSPELFRRPGFTLAPRGWYVLMGNRLGDSWTPEAAIRQFASADPRFVCLAADRF